MLGYEELGQKDFISVLWQEVQGKRNSKQILVQHQFNFDLYFLNNNVTKILHYHISCIYLFIIIFIFFKTGSQYIALAVLEFTL